MDISPTITPEDGTAPRMEPGIKIITSIPNARPTWQTTMLSPSPSPQRSPTGEIVGHDDVRDGNRSATQPTHHFPSPSPSKESWSSTHADKATPDLSQKGSEPPAFHPVKAFQHKSGTPAHHTSYVSPTFQTIIISTPPLGAALSVPCTPLDDHTSECSTAQHLKTKGHESVRTTDHDQVHCHSMSQESESHNATPQMKSVCKSPPPLPRPVSATSLRILSPPSPTHGHVRSYSASGAEGVGQRVFQPQASENGAATVHRSLSRSPEESQTRLPAVYTTTREFYPTPVRVTERNRWPAQHEGHTQPQDQEPRAQIQQASAHMPYPALPHTVHRTPHAPPHHGYPAVYGYETYDPYTALQPSQAYAPKSRLGSGYVQAAHHPAPSYPLKRPRFQIPPYPLPPIETKYRSASGLAPLQPPHLMGLDAPPKRYASPCAISPESLRAPRRRADDVQLSVLTEVFQRTSYPSTEEREDLARRLGMTSRSVQIWFQNRRRAVKVGQQSAQQLMEADLRQSEARARKLLGPPYLSEGALGGEYSVSPVPSPPGLGLGFGAGAGDMPVRSGPSGQLGVLVMPHGDSPVPLHTTVKREIPSPERRF